MTELDSGMKELISRAADGDDPTERQRSRLRTAVLAQVGGAAAVTSSAGAAAVGATAALGAAAGAATAGAGAAAGAGATVGVGGAVGAAAGGSFAAFAVKLVAIGAVLTGVGTGGYVVVSSRARPAPVGATAKTEEMVPIGAVATPGAAHKSGAAPGALGAPAAPELSAPEPSAAEAPLAPPEPVVNPAPESPVVEPAVPLVRSHAASARREPAARASDTFEEETEALREALSGLRAGHADSVLSALDAQDARYPGGVLGEERAVARIEALCVLGRTGEATARASRFLAKHPGSLQAARVRASCGGVEKAQ